MTGDYYLAHPKYSREVIRKWELGFEKRTGIELLNPFFDIKVEGVEEEDLGSDSAEAQRTYKDIVETELKYIENARKGLLAIIDENVRLGLYFEMAYASIIEKEVYAIVELENLRKHPWLRYYTNDNIFQDKESFEEFIIAKK